MPVNVNVNWTQIPATPAKHEHITFAHKITYNILCDKGIF